MVRSGFFFTQTEFCLPLISWYFCVSGAVAVGQSRFGALLPLFTQFTHGTARLFGRLQCFKCLAVWSEGQTLTA